MQNKINIYQIEVNDNHAGLDGIIKWSKIDRSVFEEYQTQEQIRRGIQDKINNDEKR